jgi:uncharacterized membrane protein YdfJ with MMPL/SSD domain
VSRRRARATLALAAVLFVAAAAFGAPVAGELESSHTDFQDPGAENLRADAWLEEALGHSQEPGLFAVVRDAPVDEVRRTITGAPDVVAFLGERTAPDGRTKVLVFAVDDEDARHGAEAARERYSSDEVLVGGGELALNELGDRVGEDLARAELIAFPLLFLLSLWVFRGLVAALLPPLVGALTILATFALLRTIDATVLALSPFALNLVIGLGLGLAIDYSLFVVSRYREEIARDGPTPEALRRTLATAGRTVLFSAITVAAALAALLVFPLRFLQSMGLGGALVALTAAAVTLLVLPAILAVLGARVNALAPARWRRAGEAEARNVQAGAWYRLSRGVMRRPGLVAVVSAALLIAAGLPFLRVEFVPADHRQLPAGAETRQASEALAQAFGADAADPMRVVIRSRDAQEVAAHARRLAEDVPGRAAVREPRRLDERTWLVDVLPRGDPLSERNQDLLERVRDEPAAFPVAVGGPTAEFADQQGALGARLPVALALLVVTTLVVLFLLTGSVVLPVKALLMNLLTLSAAFGLLVLIFQDGRLEGALDYTSAGGLEATQPVLLFAIAFGLATDYGVFLLSRIKEARDNGLGERESVAHGLQRTGRIVTAAALLFCVAIGAFATSSVLFIKQVGVGTALAVAIDASIVRALLVPSLMALLGRANWWAPAPLRRLHDRLGLAHG